MDHLYQRLTKAVLVEDQRAGINDLQARIDGYENFVVCFSAIGKESSSTKIVLHQDKAKSHISNVTRQKQRVLGWKILIRPLYSADLAISDYHLFLSKATNDLAGDELDSREA